jgi:multidrug efflux pump subunit AcrA (membrane-fusion protein)
MQKVLKNSASGWFTYLLALILLSPVSPVLARQAPVQPVRVTPKIHPVQTPASGHLTDVFFTAGDRVKRGQLLAKLERRDGTPTYLLAPVAGRIGPTRLQTGYYLAAHTTLAMIEVVALL